MLVHGSGGTQFCRPRWKIIAERERKREGWGRKKESEIEEREIVGRKRERERGERERGEERQREEERGRPFLAKEN